MAELVSMMFAELQSFAGEPQVVIPLHPPIAPVLVPLPRRVRMAEEFDFHLLELARTERKILRGDFVAETLAHLRDAEWHSHAGAVADVLEVYKDALRCF